MTDERQLLHDTVTRLFAETVTKELITEVERGAWPAELWRSVEANGLTQPHLIDSEHPEAGWWSAFPILRALGRYSVPLPLAETIVASWLLTRAGIEVPAGPLTFHAAPIGTEGLQEGKLTAILDRVPWGRHCGHAVVVAPRQGRATVVLVELEEATITEGHNLALEPRDGVELLRVAVQGSGETELPAEVLTLYGALVRCAQMSGALDALLEMSVQYAGERIQFGRPIGQFQAIQQELAKLAGYVAEAGVAAEVALRAASESRPDFAGTVGKPGDPTFEIACAKVVLCEAAELAPRIAHQVHGAIGFTYEHALQFASRRLWSWRAEYGTASEWAARLGAQALRIGADAVWPAVTSR